LRPMRKAAFPSLRNHGVPAPSLPLSTTNRCLECPAGAFIQREKFGPVRPLPRLSDGRFASAVGRGMRKNPRPRPQR